MEWSRTALFLTEIIWGYTLMVVETYRLGRLPQFRGAASRPLVPIRIQTASVMPAVLENRKMIGMT